MMRRFTSDNRFVIGVINTWRTDSEMEVAGFHISKGLSSNTLETAAIPITG